MPFTRAWSDDEKKILQQPYPAIDGDKLKKAFPGRSIGAIMDKAHRLGVKKAHERMQEMGRQNFGKRWERYRAMKAGQQKPA